MNKKIYIFLIILVSLFFVGCKSTEYKDLYIEMNKEIFITDNEEVKVYSRGKQVDYHYIDFTISDNSIGEIKDGKFIPKGYGEVTIGAIVKGNNKVYTTYDINIIPPHVRDLIVTGEFEVLVDRRLNIDVEIDPIILDSEIEWESSDEEIISVSKGIVYGVGVGEADLILTCDNFQKRVKITVLPEPTEIELEGKTSISIGEVSGFTYNIDENVVLSSNDADIVKVFDESIIGVNAGTTTIKAFRKDKPSVTGTIEITVKEDNNIGYVSLEEKGKVKEILSKMSLEQMVGHMFMIDFTSTSNWYGFTTPVDNKTGLPCFAFGNDYYDINDFIKAYPFGNFTINDYIGQNRNNLSLACRTLRDMGFKNTGIMPFIFLNSYENNEIPAINRIPSNYALSTGDSTSNLYEISDIYSKELNAYGINGFISNYINYNTSYNYTENLFGFDQKGATNYSSIMGKGFKKNKVIYIPGLSGYNYDFDDRDPYEIYNTDYELLKNAIINGANIINIPLAIYNKINSNKYTYLDKEYMVDLIRNDLGFNGVVMADAYNVERLTYYGDFYENIIKSINLGLDLINFSLIFTTNRGQAKRYKERAELLINTYNAIIDAVKNGKITKERIELANERIILAKLRNNTINNEEFGEGFNFNRSRENLMELAPNFISVIGNMSVVNTSQSTLFIAEHSKMTGTEKSSGENFQAFFKEIGYTDINISHIDKVDPAALVEKAKNYENVYVCLSWSNEDTTVGIGGQGNLFQVLREIMKVNHNVCAIIIGDTSLVNRLDFINNFIVTYGFYDNEFNNVNMILCGEVTGNRNFKR